MLKTKLPAAITTVADAKKFLSELYTNKENYHPEDDAYDVLWANGNVPPHQCHQLNRLMLDIYNLEGNAGNHSNSCLFDPCEFLLSLDEPDCCYDRKKFYEQALELVVEDCTSEAYNDYVLKTARLGEGIINTYIYKADVLIGISTAHHGEFNTVTHAKKKIDIGCY